jgi:hypothetical protein
MHGHVLFGGAQEHDARLTIADIGAQTLGHLRPQAVGGQRHRHVAGRARCLAHPAQIARGLFARDPSLFQHHHGNAPFAQRERGGQADDAPPMITTVVSGGKPARSGQGRLLGPRDTFLGAD